MTEPEAVLISDWSELEEALVVIDDYADRYTDWYEDHDAAWQVIKTYVPRLLTQYERLLELSFVLTERVADERAAAQGIIENQTPAGLYIPTADIRTP